MKKTIFIAVCLLFSAQAKSQDAIIVGARNYYKSHLKNPSSYVEYSSTKKGWTTIDELELSLEEYSYTIEDSSVMVNLDKERSKFLESVSLKAKNLEITNSVLKSYTDSTKFLKDFESLKNTKLEDLNRMGAIFLGALNEAKEKGDVDNILRYQKLVEEVNDNIKNIDEYIKTLESYKNLHLIQYTENQKEIALLNEIISYRNNQIEKFDSLAVLDYQKNYKDQICSSCGMLSYYLERYQERENAISKTKEIRKKISYLKSNPTKNSLLYYYVILDNSGTNSYGARVREKNTIKYDLKLRQYEIID